MKIKLYSVRDSKTEAYMQPFPGLTHGQILREFTTEINDSNNDKSLIRKYPEDHDLYYLGEFDTDLGKFESKGPELLALGKNIITKQ